MNIKGSGQGDSRACRFNQRLAITLEGKPDDVYQLQLPATSIFGEAKNGNMGMQAYAKFLNAHNTPIIAVMTEMYFDENAETPKLFFKPIRPLDEPELRAAVAAKDSEDATKAITMTVGQTDGVTKKAAPPAPKAPALVAPPAADEDDEEEPTKVSTKKTEAPKPAGDLAALVGQWDDE
jgi:hypothetical protein